ncbi:MAG TPA: ATP-binding protein [Caulobacteraceae bacterium]|nr:ATP-binding protein [Caulobacteraceae bacterium]
MGRLAFTLAICLGTMPFAGIATPAAWFAGMLALILGESLWKRWSRAERRLGLNPFDWLLNAGYSAAAFYLTYNFPNAAETLGVTLYGVTLFQILARDYACRRRLIANLIPPVASMVAIQFGATALYITQQRPFEIVTLVASPLIVISVFRRIHDNLSANRASEREAKARAEEAARQIGEAHRLALLAEALAGIGHWRIDVPTRASTWSDGVFRIYGFDQAQGVPSIPEILAVYDEPDRDTVRQCFRRLFDTGEPFQFEAAIRRPNGERRHVVANGAAERNAAGQVATAFGAFLDVTEARRREHDLIEAKQRAEAAAEAKSEFLANMSHEIRTPLTGIIGFADLLDRADDLGPQSRAHVRRIVTSGQSLLAVVNDILDFSKLEAGRLTLDPQPFDLRRFLEDTVAAFEVQARTKGLALELAVSDAAPAGVVADAARLRQVLVNLIGNALKFTAAGGVRIEASWADGRLDVAVRDTGVGIPAEKLDRLFQRFSQVDGSVSRRYGGAGLGLSICKSLVELMGGDIAVTSAENAGSTFAFWIAAPEGEAATAEPVAAEDPDAPPCNILLVDDLEANRELIGTLLTALGQSVRTANGGAEAISAAMAETFDLILMDLQMPGMDGFAAARAIRELASPNRFTPILALSANVLPEHVLASAAAGMNGHLGKPVVIADLATALGRWAGVRLDEAAADAVGEAV